MSNRIVYASFDRFPSPKGAATHIDAFVSELGRSFGNVDLLTIQSEAAELRGRADETSTLDDASEMLFKNWSAEGVEHHPFLAPGEHLFERVISFRTQIWNWWERRFSANNIRPIVHFRSIYEGYPIAREKNRFCDRIVFEVNGLPSIEMKYRYPNVAEDSELLRKLKHQEQVCLDAADLILTVSQVNAEHLMWRGVSADRIRIIRNGVDLDLFSYHAAVDSPDDTLAADRPMRLLYAGTMSAWQGVPQAIEALALYKRDFPAKLTLVGPVRPRQRKELLNQAWEQGVFDDVELLEPVSKVELAALHAKADVILAPLTRNDRNLVQGCCPLKVLEAMASGTPIIASDLAVVRELATNGVEAILVRAGSGKAIKDGMLRLRSEPGLANRLSIAARERVEKNFSWQKAQRALVAAYEDLLASTKPACN